MKTYITAVLLLLSCTILAQDMTPEKMRLILAQEAIVMEEEGSIVQYDYGDIPIMLIYDVDANRMRLISPVIEAAKLTESDLELLMEANFDRALDAKYAISNGLLWSAYAHPLRELQEEQLKGALRQVRNLVLSYGDTYTSTEYVFGGGDN